MTMLRSFSIVVISLGILAAFPIGCWNVGSNPAPSSVVSSETTPVPSSVVSSETPVENGGIAAAAPTLTAPQDPLSDVESVIEQIFGYKLRASYGPRFDVPLDPNDPEILSSPMGGPVELRLLPQWIHVTKDGVPYGRWYSTLDGASLRYIWTPSGEGAGRAKACDLVLKDTGGPIGTEVDRFLALSGTQVRLPLATGRLKVYAYDPAWEMAPREMVEPFPGLVPSCEEGLGPLSAEDLEKFTSRKFVATGESIVFHVASFDLTPVAEISLPPKTLSTIPMSHR